MYAHKDQEARCAEDRPPPADLDHAKTSVLNSLSSPRSRRNYKFAMEQFITGTVPSQGLL